MPCFLKCDAHTIELEKAAKRRQVTMMMHRISARANIMQQNTYQTCRNITHQKYRTARSDIERQTGIFPPSTAGRRRTSARRLPRAVQQP